ncbi:hypothetical protein Mpet_2029 [Methanolacinia petrolearia DSM 11571]|uniref:Uncharacterized protein n=1 Tax=Methanolacinia petrolearia (strain DSM 11571 / OCM 486 / SEBR 4847) TaxID=679926 RepID=E1RJH1_METP4|nr:hypothetical protein [Methanolacinia petrolearia]ADN36777.1 hypothetical protein Mpet_2029 [Methanolacinia petrolearia DSM 11571]
MGIKGNNPLKSVYKFGSCLSKCLRKDGDVEDPDEISSEEEEEIYSIFEKNDLFERTSLILEEARIQFDRFGLNINLINSKIIASFQIFLVLVTIQTTVFLYFLGTREMLDSSYYVFGWFLIFSILTFVIFLFLLLPKEYKYPSVFGEERREKLSRVEKYQIVSDFLYHTIDSYDSNRKTYSILKDGYVITLFLILLNLIIFGILILSLLELDIVTFSKLIINTFF